MRQILLLFIGLTVWSSPAAGQTLSRGPAASVLFSGAARGPLRLAQAGEPADSIVREIRPTYWKEGALVGGVGGALLGGGFCGMSDQVDKDCGGAAVLGGVVGAALLAIPGALIGGQFSKGATESLPD